MGYSLVARKASFGAVVEPPATTQPTTPPAPSDTRRCPGQYVVADKYGYSDECVSECGPGNQRYVTVDATSGQYEHWCVSPYTIPGRDRVWGLPFEPSNYIPVHPYEDPGDWHAGDDFPEIPAWTFVLGAGAIVLAFAALISN